LPTPMNPFAKVLKIVGVGDFVVRTLLYKTWSHTKLWLKPISIFSRTTFYVKRAFVKKSIFPKWGWYRKTKIWVSYWRIKRKSHSVFCRVNFALWADLSTKVSTFSFGSQ
jgi:hypothetical protein